MENSVFREKSIAKVSSPEQLDQYLKVTSASVWMILLAIIVVLVGTIVWGVFGTLETKVSTGCQVENGIVTCYIKEEDFEKVKKGMEIRIDGCEEVCVIDSLTTRGIEVSKQDDNYLVHLVGVNAGDFVYYAEAKCILQDGVYKANIILEEVSPLKFIFN